MTWVNAVPWRKIAKKVWTFLAFDRRGRSRERAIIVVGALILTVFIYIWAVDAVDPSRNLFRLGWQEVRNREYTIASGREGGWYVTLADEIEERLEEKGKFGVKVENVGGSGAILKKVLYEPLTLGIVQEDVLVGLNSNGRRIRVIATLYNERQHFVYRWSKLQELQEPASGESIACKELRELPERTCGAEVILAEDPNCLTRELISNSVVRLGSRKRPVGRLNTPQRVLAMAGLQPKDERWDLSIDDAIDELVEQTVDVAFITSGAPVRKLESEFKKGPDSDLCLAAIDARFTRNLNGIYETHYRFSGFSEIYPTRFDQITSFEVSAVLVASPRVPRSFIRSVTEALYELKTEEVDRGRHHPLEDFDQIDTLPSELPSWRFEVFQACVVFGLFFFGVWSALIGLATWVVSSFKVATYSRRLQRVYEQLPSNVHLEKGPDGAPIPKLEGDTEEVVSRIVDGIADLLRLAMDIREDYETGGITSSNYHHLIEGVYHVKEIFTRHLAQRLHYAIETDAGAVSTNELARYYTAGYLSRDDFCFLRDISSPLPDNSM